jgi:hypothetical protein
MYLAANHHSISLVPNDLGTLLYYISLLIFSETNTLAFISKKISEHPFNQRHQRSILAYFCLKLIFTVYE